MIPKAEIDLVDAGNHTELIIRAPSRTTVVTTSFIAIPLLLLCSALFIRHLTHGNLANTFEVLLLELVILAIWIHVAFKRHEQKLTFHPLALTTQRQKFFYHEIKGVGISNLSAVSHNGLTSHIALGWHIYLDHNSICRPITTCMSKSNAKNILQSIQSIMTKYQPNQALGEFD